MNDILACIDGGPQTAGVCDHAVWAAQRLGAPLQFLHVLEHKGDHALIGDYSGSLGLGAQETLLHELSALDEKQSRLAQDQGWQTLEVARERAVAAGIEPDTRQRHGSLIDNLLELEPTTRLVVVGQRLQPGAVPRLHLDQNVERIVRTLHKPVLVATSTFMPPARCIIAFDGSPTGRRLIETLASSPLLRGLACHIVSAGPATAELEAQREWAQGLLVEAGLEARSTRQDGNADAVLHDAISNQQGNLLVMGAYGHSRIREFIVGSTTTAMLRTSPVPVLILR